MNQFNTQTVQEAEPHPQDPKTPLTYSLKTTNCLTHVWCVPKVATAVNGTAQRFFNEIPRAGERNNWTLFKWLLLRKSNTWDVDYAQETQLLHASEHGLPQNRPQASLDDWQVWWVGHATVLIQIGPYNFLTDPVWCEHVSPRQGMGPKRVAPAGIALEQLPQIHAVLLSHNHYDHMDISSLSWLHQKFAMPIYTGLGNAYYLDKSWHVIEMDWWQSALFHGLKIVYTPAQHGSGRGLLDQDAALWGGFSLLNEHGHCFFAGDSGYSPHFKQIQQRLGHARIAILPIGAYEPRELMRYMHMNPQEAFQAHVDLQAKRSLAVHYRTFQLTDETREQPQQQLQQTLQRQSKLMNPFYCLKEGQKLSV
ncbi:MBL fold metallo-hydrolase [Acinetobacter rudis]|uniref:MBL fold metallo-hydrolase n=1 Tax=Acinetobacter rudis TaxID=632955 RepID=UPI00333EE1BC